MKRDEGESFSTLTGTIMGTPQYMSPEQARGEVETLDTRSDIYALGAILLHLLFLRPPVSGNDAQDVVEKVQRGEVDWPSRSPGEKGTKRLPHLPSGRMPDSLLAVCRKALTLDPAARYARVEDLQRDLTAYQSGFATSAEKAGTWKQITLLVKRHQATSVGIAAVLLVGITLGTKAVIEGRRAERAAAHAIAEAKRAELALADLKRQAPALRQLAESEAGFQRFDSALDKLDAALALDPAHLPSYWRRAWLFIGMDRLPDAAAAIRRAKEKDPAHGELAAILPTIEKLAALLPTQRWPVESARQLYDHLVKVGASGETLAFSAKLKLGAKDNEKLVRQRLDEWLGKGKGDAMVLSSGLLRVGVSKFPIDNIEPLRGLPIDELDISKTNVASIEPLRAMHLVLLNVASSNVADLSPLRGMQLRSITMNSSKVTDLSPLRGAPLEFASIGTMGNFLTDSSPLRGAPLRKVNMAGLTLRDLTFLANSPVEELNVWNNKISDLSPLRGKPLRTLNVRQNSVNDLSPLRGAPIEMLEIDKNPLKDLTPLLDLPKLERLRVSKLGKLLEPLRAHPSLKYIAYDDEPYRPVAEFWAEYDASQRP